MRKILRRTGVACLITSMALMMTSCGPISSPGSSGPVIGGNQTWTFQFFDQSGPFATTDVLMSGGASVGPATITLYTVATFGCDFLIDFDVQFSGSLVRLLLFRRNMASTCSGMTIDQAYGDGNANGSYGSANYASGSGVLILDAPGTPPAGGPYTWVATRQ